MALGVVVFLAVPTLLVLLGAAEIVLAVLDLRSPMRVVPGRRLSARLLLVAGIGTVICAVISLAPLYSELQYGAVLWPVIALALALIWNVVAVGGAILARVVRPRTPGA
ncbi:hypothetical protein [Brachybacterium phenoliresistens]|uniref:hypothetical protein n=1 Tax=Brachybacterium phenoliresistens TaxID=396014 RepID=UPI0031D3254D